jgi:hypothetical protein
MRVAWRHGTERPRAGAGSTCTACGPQSRPQQRGAGSCRHTSTGCRSRPPGSWTAVPPPAGGGACAAWGGRGRPGRGGQRRRRAPGRKLPRQAAHDCEGVRCSAALLRGCAARPPRQPGRRLWGGWERRARPAGAPHVKQRVDGARVHGQVVVGHHDVIVAPPAGAAGSWRGEMGAGVGWVGAARALPAAQSAVGSSSRAAQRWQRAGALCAAGCSLQARPDALPLRLLLLHQRPHHAPLEGARHTQRQRALRGIRRTCLEQRLPVQPACSMPGAHELTQERAAAAAGG